MSAKIAAAFVAAKKAFSPALKDKTNPAFRSKYADLGACIDAVNDALLDQGIAVYQETFLDDSGVTVETVFLHESGETLRGGKFHVPASKQDPQGYGSALTYARRYSLQAACGIAPEDDDGNAASGGRPAKSATLPPPEPPVYLNDEQITRVQDYLDLTGKSWEWLCKQGGVSSKEEILASSYDAIVSAFEKLLKKIEETK